MHGVRKNEGETAALFSRGVRNRGAYSYDFNFGQELHITTIVTNVVQSVYAILRNEGTEKTLEDTAKILHEILECFVTIKLIFGFLILFTGSDMVVSLFCHGKIQRREVNKCQCSPCRHFEYREDPDDEVEL